MLRRSAYRPARGEQFRRCIRDRLEMDVAREAMVFAQATRDFDQRSIV
jgi:hypothetical protein